MILYAQIHRYGLRLSKCLFRVTLAAWNFAVTIRGGITPAIWWLLRNCSPTNSPTWQTFRERSRLLAPYTVTILSSTRASATVQVRRYCAFSLNHLQALPFDSQSVLQFQIPLQVDSAQGWWWNISPMAVLLVTWRNTDRTCARGDCCFSHHKSVRYKCRNAEMQKRVFAQSHAYIYVESCFCDFVGYVTGLSSYYLEYKERCVGMPDWLTDRLFLIGDGVFAKHAICSPGSSCPEYSRCQRHSGEDRRLRPHQDHSSG